MNLFNTLFDSQIISNKDKLKLKLKIIKICLSIFNIDGSIMK